MIGSHLRKVHLVSGLENQLNFLPLSSGLQVELLQGSCGLVQLLQFDGSILRLPEPLPPAELNVLLCLEVDVPLALVQVRQQQLLGKLDPTLEIELVEGHVRLAHFGNLNI